LRQQGIELCEKGRKKYIVGGDPEEKKKSTDIAGEGKRNYRKDLTHR